MLRIVVKNRLFPAAVLFTMVFAWFLFRHHYYAPSTLKIQGNFNKYDSIVLRWDTGTGFQPRQTYRVMGMDFSKPVELPHTEQAGPHRIRYNLEKVAEDALYFEIDGWALIGGIDARASTLYIVLESKTRQQAFSVRQRSRHDVTQHFSEGINYTNSGFTCRLQRNMLPPDEYRISIYIKQAETGLSAWTATDKKISVPPAGPQLQDAPFATTLRLPQLDITKLLIETSRDCTAIVELEDGTSLLPSSRTQAGIQFDELGRHARRLHPLLIAAQAMLAFLIAWGLYELRGLLVLSRKHTLWGALSFIFYDERRWIFWALFAATGSVQSLWLVGQWPGIMTVDSLIYWHHIKTLQFREAWLYLVYLLMLTQLFDSPAVIGLFQIIMIAAIGSAVFHFAVRRGVPFYIVLPFLLLFVFSGPIGIYNITIWKDIPFSYLIILCAVYLFYKNSTGTRREEHSWKKITVFSFLFISLCLIRPNGIVFALLLPLIEWCKGFLSSKTRIKYAAILVILFILCKYAIPSLLHEQDYAGVNLPLKTNPFAALFSARSYYSDNYKKDAEIVQKIIGLDELKKNYDPSMATELINKVNYSKLTKDDVDYFQQVYFKRMYTNLPLFLADRVNIFVSLLCSVNSAIHGVCGNNIVNDDHYRIIAKFPSVFSSGLTLYNLAFEPKNRLLSKLQTRIDTYMQLGINKLVFWNLLFPSLCLLGAWLLYKWLPSSALFSLVILFQAPFLLLTIMTPSFRFLYFVSPAGVLLFPLVLVECKEHLARQTRLKQLTQKQGSILFAIIAVVSYGLATAQHLILLLIT